MVDPIALIIQTSRVEHEIVVRFKDPAATRTLISLVQ
jgi:hypothetical protein